MIDCEVSPELHKYAAPALAVKVTLPPWQNVVDPLAVIVGVGNGFTVTTVEVDVAVHPSALVTVTLYVPEFVTVML